MAAVPRRTPRRRATAARAPARVRTPKVTARPVRRLPAAPIPSPPTSRFFSAPPPIEPTPLFRMPGRMLRLDSVPPSVRLIGWTYVMSGFAGLLLAFFGVLFLWGSTTILDPAARIGLALGVAIPIPLNGLALATGLNLLLLREWARRTAVAIALLSLGLLAIAAATVLLTHLATRIDLGPVWLVPLGLVSSLIMGVFMAWALVVLLEPDVADLFRPLMKPAPTSI